MKQVLLLFIFSILTLSAFSQMTIAKEDFDGTSTWTNNAATSTFVDPSSSNQGLFIQAGTNLGPDNVLFGRDLQNEDGEPQLNPVTITFDDVDISMATGVIVSFEYDLNGFDSSDEIAYTLTVDGSDVDMGTFGGDDAGTYMFNVADAASSVSLTLVLDQNGGSDSFELDNFMVTAEVILPIELTYFRAKAVNNKTVALEWRTETEVDNHYMMVERSRNGKEFAELAKVKGNGTTLEAQVYTFVDDAPRAGVNYYRLKQVDFDGTYEYHNVVAVNITDDKNFSVYPTLVDNTVNVNIEGQANLTIRNIAGAVVKTVQVTDFQSIDVGNLVKGTYFMIIESNNLVEAVRFVKQ